MLYKNGHSNKNYNNVYHWLIGNWFIDLFHTEFNICGFFGVNCVSQMLENSLFTQM